MSERRYHVNPMTGSPSICRAEKGRCPYGGSTGESNHYDTYSEAQKASQMYFEKMYQILPDALSVNENEVVKELKEKQKIKNLESIPTGTQNEICDKIMDSENENLVMGIVDGEIYQDSDWEYTSVALQNKNISKRFLKEALYDYPDEFDLKARTWLSLNESLSHDEVVSIIEDENENMQVRTVALQNKNLKKEYIEGIMKDTSKLDKLPYSGLYFSQHRTKESDTLMMEAVIFQRRYGGDILKGKEILSEYKPWRIKRQEEG